MSDLTTDMDATIAELQRRLDEIAELVDGLYDITARDAPNVFMQILTIAKGQDKP